MKRPFFLIAIFMFFMFAPQENLLAQKPRITLKGNDTLTIYRIPKQTGCYIEQSFITYVATDSVQGDLTNSVVQSTNLNCKVNGWYWIKLKVTNAKGLSDSVYRHLYVRDPLGLPNPDFTILSPLAELYYNVGIKNEVDSGAYEYEWVWTSPSGWENNSINFDPNITADEVGWYRVCLRARNVLGWSNWKCSTFRCTMNTNFYIGYPKLIDSDTGTLYDNGGPLMNYSNNRKTTVDYVTIQHDCLELQLNIEKLQLADTGDRLFIYEGTTALHPAGGFGPGSITSFPLIFICDSDSVIIKFKSNSSGTDSGFVITWKPAGQESVSGFVYLDIDSNCKYDPLIDFIANDYTVKIKNKLLQVSNTTGRFATIGDTSKKIITLYSTKYWTAHCPSGGVDTWTLSNKGPFEFGLKPGNLKRCDFSTIAVNQFGPATVRGVKCTMTLHSQNIGNVKADKLNCSIYSSRKLSYIKRLKNTYTATDTSLTFTQNVMHPFLRENSEEIEYMVKPGESGTVKFRCNCYPNIKDNDSSNNRSKLDLTIVNAFDPNDKLASVADSFYSKPEQIVYRVRFQNTGTWPATDVIVRDTLSPLLDTNTLTLLETSHACEMERTGYAVAFKFMNIQLQDSTRNEPESHGHLFYSIKPVNKLNYYQPILNTAHIYFDAEKPVVTNTTSNQWVLPVSTRIKQQSKSHFIIFPNPASQYLTIRAESNEQITYSLTDIHGRLCLSDQFLGNEHTVNTAHLKSGMYIMNIEQHGQSESYQIFIR